MNQQVPVNFNTFDESFVFSAPDQGHRALPGNYKVSLSKYEDGVYTELAPAVPFKCVSLNAGSFQVGRQEALQAFTIKVAELRRVVTGTEQYRREQENKLRYLRAALLKTTAAPLDLSQQILQLENRVKAASVAINGDPSLGSREFETSPSINGRLGRMTGGLWNSSVALPVSFETSYALVEKEFKPIYNEVKAIGEDVKKLEAQMEKYSAPFHSRKITRTQVEEGGGRRRREKKGGRREEAGGRKESFSCLPSPSSRLPPVLVLPSPVYLTNRSAKAKESPLKTLKSTA
jgi:hypothetical protein